MSVSLSCSNTYGCKGAKTGLHRARTQWRRRRRRRRPGDIMTQVSNRLEGLKGYYPQDSLLRCPQWKEMSNNWGDGQLYNASLKVTCIRRPSKICIPPGFHSHGKTRWPRMSNKSDIGFTGQSVRTTFLLVYPVWCRQAQSPLNSQPRGFGSGCASKEAKTSGVY